MDSSESEVHGCVKEQLVLLQDKGSIVITIYDVYLQHMSVETINFSIYLPIYTGYIMSLRTVFKTVLVLFMFLVNRRNTYLTTAWN